MNRGNFLLQVLALTLLLLFAANSVTLAASVPRMSTDELNSRLGENGLVVLDVRSSYHWGSSDKKIQGSERVAPGKVAEWALNYSKKENIVLYCA